MTSPYIYDYSKLLGKLREMRITQAELAKALGLSETSLNKKLKNKTEFKQSEMIKICIFLAIPIECINSYFFAK